jgi:AraC family transcriptional regulator
LARYPKADPAGFAKPSSRRALGVFEIIQPILVHIQANLESELTLERVARRAGLSPFHFHRTFRQVKGSTLRRYVERLRLERAAFRLLLHEGTVLDVALECGYRNHETFTRAFRARFGVAPIAYRQGKRCELMQLEEFSRRVLDNPARGFELSPTRIVRVRARDIAFIRHVGPYEEVSDSMWAALTEFADRNGWTDRLLFGIGHDAPGITAASELRFDAGILAPGPFAPTSRIAHQKLPGGFFALTSTPARIRRYRKPTGRFSPLCWSGATSI